MTVTEEGIQRSDITKRNLVSDSQSLGELYNTTGQRIVRRSLGYCRML
jgi:hypothetical protein